MAACLTAGVASDTLGFLEKGGLKFLCSANPGGTSDHRRNAAQLKARLCRLKFLCPSRTAMELQIHHN